MTSAAQIARHVLVAGTPAGYCAVPLEHVIETMRPLPVEALAGMPPCVMGLAIIRGAPTPVVSLAGLLGAAQSAGAERFVLVRTGERTVALAVDSVVGIAALDDAAFQEIPPLLRDANSELISAIGVLDAKLLVVLRSTRVAPDGVWQALAAQGGAAP